MSKHITRYVPGFFAAVVGLTCLGSVGAAQSRTEVTIADTGVTPENLTSGRDGTVYFGSMAKGTIYRAAPGAARGAVDSRVSHWPNERARRLGGRQDEHAVGLPE